MIEEAHTLARRVLEEHVEELHKISGILIERETIDKDQFVRLLQGEDEEAVFGDEPLSPSEPEGTEEKKRRAPKPRPFPLPGATMQPPPPEGAKG